MLVVKSKLTINLQQVNFRVHQQLMITARFYGYVKEYLKGNKDKIRCRFIVKGNKVDFIAFGEE